MDFEWDDAKTASNEAKHKVSFPYAARVFLDSKRLDAVDNQGNYQEERWITIGKIEGRVFLVVYTRRGSAICLISARKANVREQKEYLKVSA